jgi:phosphate-selective porin OprO/OprP
MKTSRTLATTLSLAALASAASAGDAGTTASDSPPSSQAPAAPAESSGTRYPFLESLKTLVESENLEIKWGGSLFFDAGFFHGDDEYPIDTQDGAEFRRARLFAEGELYQAVDFKAEYDFSSGGEAALKDVYVGLETSIGRIQTGHFKQPFGLESLTSSRFITFMERSSATEAFAPERDDGIQMADTIGTTNWAVAASRRSDDFGKDTGDGEYSYTGRLTHAFVGEGGDVLHLGVAAIERASMPSDRVRARPEAHLLDRVFDSGVVSTDGTHVYGGELAWVRGPLSIQGEYLRASFDEVDGGEDADLSGYYAFLSWFLTGESRNYKVQGAKFDRVKPAENYTGKGLGGAWEVALRYSSLDADDGPFSETVDNVTLGLNWYLNPNSRLMFNLLQSNAEDDTAGFDGDMTAFMVRWQVDF